MAKYWLYYAGYEKATGLEQIGLATSDDLRVWKRASQSPIIPVGASGEADAVQTSNPYVLKEAGLFRMWYQGKAKSGKLSICYAESEDGIAWKAVPSAIFSHPDVTGEYREGYHHPHVLFDATRRMYRMWFSFQKNEMACIGYAESPDGREWTIVSENVLSPEVPWEGTFLYYPFVSMRADGVYEMWYTGRSSVGRWMTGRATSPDGIVWTKDPQNPLLPRTLLSRPVRSMLEKLLPSFFVGTALNGTGSVFLFAWNGAPALLAHDVGARGHLSIGLYGASKNGVWIAHARNILDAGHDAWDSYFQADPFLILHE